MKVRPTVATQKTHGVESARRVLQILFNFTAENPIVSVEALAEMLGCSVGSVYRYIALLREFFLVEEHSRGFYRLTPRVYALSDSVDSLRDLKTVARPVLEQLARASTETAVLVRPLDDVIVCVDAVETDHALRLTFTPGQLLSMHRGASAKVILSAMPKRKQSKYFEGLLERGALSLESLNTLKLELATISKTGYAESHAEVDAGAWAAAAAIRQGSEVVASISVAGPATRLSESKREQIHSLVLEAAAQVNRNLQGTKFS